MVILLRSKEQDFPRFAPRRAGDGESIGKTADRDQPTINPTLIPLPDRQEPAKIGRYHHDRARLMPEPSISYLTFEDPRSQSVFFEYVHTPCLTLCREQKKASKSSRPRSQISSLDNSIVPPAHGESPKAISHRRRTDRYRAFKSEVGSAGGISSSTPAAIFVLFEASGRPKFILDRRAVDAVTLTQKIRLTQSADHGDVTKFYICFGTPLQNGSLLG